MSKEHCSSISLNVANGYYVRNSRFADFGSVVTDTIFGQQAEADRRLEAIKAKRKEKQRK